MNRANKEITVCLLLIIYISFNLYFAFRIKSFKFNNSGSYIDLEYPKSSAGEITINTPANQTYIEPMRGYYPGTYGFENETVGSEPSGLDKAIDTSCSIQVIEGLAGHKNIVELNDQSSSGRSQIIIENSYWASSNTYEFYLRVTDAFKAFFCGIYYLVPNQRAFLKIEEYKFQYFDGSYHDVYHNAFDDTWYHIKIVHTSVNWYVTIDGISYGPYGYQAAGGIFNAYTFGSSDPATDYIGYLDAIGFDTDINYDIGNNLNEGLLLNYNSNDTFDWQGYSLDDQVNKTILGNTTIPMPNDGLHKVQVFGNSSGGLIYESPLRHFTVDTASFPNLEIITPENRTYTSPMSGYYPATYGFENDKVGSEPSGVDKVVDPSCSLQVIEEMAEHRNVIEFNDQSNSGRSHFNIDNSYWASSNTFEYYLRVSDASQAFFCGIYYSTPNQRAIFKIESYKFQQFDGSYDDVGHFASDNTWYHLKVVHTSINWFLHIDGIQYGPFGYQAAGGIMNGYAFGSSDSATNYIGYIDALGFDSDANYEVGDNLYEGLLISYLNNSNLDWVSYSLDGYPNITLTGDKVIPIPENGARFIILSGISQGITIQSELREFYISIQEPPIIPEPPPDFPIFITVIIASLGICIVALIGIIIFLSRRKRIPLGKPVIITSKEPQVDKKINAGSDKLKVCPFCFAQIMKTSKFCTHCGASLTNN